MDGDLGALRAGGGMLQAQPPDAPGPPDSLSSWKHSKATTVIRKSTQTHGNVGAAPLDHFAQSPQIALRRRPSAGRAAGVTRAEPARRILSLGHVKNPVGASGPHLQERIVSAFLF